MLAREEQGSVVHMDIILVHYLDFPSHLLGMLLLGVAMQVLHKYSLECTLYFLLVEQSCTQ